MEGLLLRLLYTVIYKSKGEEGVDETAAELEDMRDIIANIYLDVKVTRHHDGPPTSGLGRSRTVLRGEITAEQLGEFHISESS